MDDKSSFYTRHMLLQYGRQLTSSRRLARYQQLLGTGGKANGPSPETQRKLMVEKVSREVVDNLIFTGSENPVVLEVRQRLNDSTGEVYSFQYPPGELEFKVFRKTPEGEEELELSEKHLIMGKLLEITREAVAETML